MVLAPEGSKPEEVLVEHAHTLDQSKMEWYERKKRMVAKIAWLKEKASFSPLGSLFLSSLFPIHFAHLYSISFRPDLAHQARKLLEEVVLKPPRTQIQNPYNSSQAAEILAKSFRNIGTVNNFAPFVLVVGHASTSLNNPFSAAYNCGACGGREGGPNARLFSKMANDKDVRKKLLEEHNIHIPEDTLFVGSLHNTTADTIQYYDVELLPKESLVRFKEVEDLVGDALGKNALERCDRFLLAEKVKTPQEALEHTYTRSHDLAEVRPGTLLFFLYLYIIFCFTSFHITF